MTTVKEQIEVVLAAHAHQKDSMTDLSYQIIQLGIAFHAPMINVYNARTTIKIHATAVREQIEVEVAAHVL